MKNRVLVDAKYQYTLQSPVRSLSPAVQIRDRVTENHDPFWHMHTDLLSMETGSAHLPVCGWNEVRTYVYALTSPSGTLLDQTF